MINNYDVGSIVQMKKSHPCGCNLFEIIRVGVDIKIKCTKCGHVIMLDRLQFNKKIKKVVDQENG